MDEGLSLDPLDLDGLMPSPRVGPGRQAAPLQATYVRDLTPADLAIPATVTQTAPPLKKLRDSHHALARLIATATPESTISEITGYSLSRISILKADPQFNELCEFYRKEAREVSADFAKRMALVGLDALQALHERILDDDSKEDKDKMSAGLLKDIVRDMADRTGHAPQRGPAAQTNIQINLTEQMSAARERINRLMAERRASPRTIDHAPSSDS